jgi:hypothetical protein
MPALQPDYFPQLLQCPGGIRVSGHIQMHIYYGSRAAQPKRVRAFLDLAIARLHDSPDYVLSNKELATAQHKWARKPRE